MEKSKSRKKLTAPKIIVFVFLSLVIAIIVFVQFRPFAMDALPVYPSATAVKLATTNDFEQEIASGGGGLYFIDIDENSLHFQTFITSDNITNIVNFYEKYGQSAGYAEIIGNDFGNKNLFFKRNFFTSDLWDKWVTEDQNITGVKILDESNPYDAKIIAQLIKQPTPDTKVIVLIQGFGRFYEDY